MQKLTSGQEVTFGCWVPGSLFLITLFAWLTHIVTCFKDESYLLLIAGAIAFPIGIIHGFLIWIGLA